MKNAQNKLVVIACVLALALSPQMMVGVPLARVEAKSVVARNLGARVITPQEK